ncbi:MAG: 16S rRNA (adenine(1518)-N(6)/adenine(1519)-N(6))-dimethyltransferase RsmA [Coprobacillus sp.]|nr:16S rRNA (adenine(1518)-N(6)/adenine(1519)-N(6))-dimethyltransferase RsmA [Coprobacillus sp.]
MEINSKNIKSVLGEIGVTPDINYGQNFLIEPIFSKRIVDLLNIQNNDKILEIGAGLGSLSHFLTSFSNDITLLDVDNNMTTFLQLFYKSDNVKIINNDIRRTNVSTYTKIVSNLPYNLTTEIVVYLCLNAVESCRLVLMCENETLLHFTSLSGKDYGPVSVLIHLLGDIKKEFTVPASAFYPSPKCTSTVFTIDFNSQSNRNDVKNTYLMCKELFLNRRKTIYNNLKRYLNNDELCGNILNELGISFNARPEEIDYKTYFEMYERIKLSDAKNTTR